MTGRSVLVSLVTFNDESFLESCLRSLRGQTLEHRVKIHDNASTDGSVTIARGLGAVVEAHPRNIGYCGGHNRNLRDLEEDFALLLNADVILDPGYLQHLASLLQKYPRVGLAGGKLLRMDSKGTPVTCDGRPVLDSSGIYFTPSQRHFDRGSGEVDRGQYDQTQFVFGVTGAALFCRREMVEDLRLRTGEFLDEHFFAYREDAELAWRGQILGWKALYLPEATAYHCRRVVPERRSDVDSRINFHSVKNRYLMRMKDMGPRVRRRCFPYAWLRDAGIFLYMLLWERSSLPALSECWRLRRKFRAKKQMVERHRQVSDGEIAAWFRFQPCASRLAAAGEIPDSETAK